jgi:hypothetical protein
MIEIPDSGFGVVQMAFQRQDDMRFAFVPAAEQFPDFAKSGFQFLQLSWSQFYLSAGVGDFHGVSQLKA